MFCWMDLREGLGGEVGGGWEGERRLWQRLIDAGVVLTPGTGLPQCSVWRGAMQ
jgi:hypothetical protein